MCSKLLVCGLSAVAAVAESSGGIDVSSLQDSLSSGGVDGLTKVLAAMSSQFHGISDSSMHIKKDEDGNAMYDFVGASTTAQLKAVPVTAPPLPKVTLPPLPSMPALPTMDPSLANMNFGIIEKSAAKKASPAAAATTSVAAVESKYVVRDSSPHKQVPPQPKRTGTATAPPLQTTTEEQHKAHEASTTPTPAETTAVVAAIKTATTSAPQQPSGGIDVSSLQESLRSGGVDGLTKVLAAMSSQFHGHSDSSMHIKKDADGNAMYDFSNPNVRTSTTAHLKTTSAPGADEGDADGEASTTSGPAETTAASAAKVEETGGDDDDEASTPAPVEATTAVAEASTTPTPAESAAVAAAIKTATVAAAEKTSAPGAEEGDADDEASTTSGPAGTTAASAAKVEETGGDDDDDEASTPAPVEATTVAAEASTTAAPVGVASGQITEQLAKGLAAVRNSLGHLLGEAKSLKREQAPAAASSAMSARVVHLEQEHGLMEKELREQASDVRRLLAEQRVEATEVSKLKAANSAIRGILKNNAKRVVFLSKDDHIKKQQRTVTSDIRTFFHRKVKRSHVRRHDQ